MAIDLGDYRHTSAHRGWGEGWPSCSGARDNLATVLGNNPDGSVAARVTVHKRLARLVDLLLDECERRGYQLHADQCGGYNCRAISGTSSPSNHSWGVAVDINWRLNPLRMPLTTNIPRWMVELWNRYGFAWGGLYGDPMHLEFMGTPADADTMTALTLYELSFRPPGTPRSGDDDMMLDLRFFDEHGQPDPAGLNFRGACPAEVGAGSQVVARAWVRWTAKWGACTWKVVAWDATRPIGEADLRKDYWELPTGSRSFTVEGRREHAGVIPSAVLLQKAK